MPFRMEDMAGNPCIIIDDTGHIGFGCDPNPNAKLTIGGFTLLDLVQRFWAGVCKSQAVTPTKISVTTTPGQTVQVSTAPTVTSGGGTAQPVITPVFNATDSAISADSNYLTVQDRRPAGSGSRTLQMVYW